MGDSETKILSEESPSVQTHLGILQTVIQRMAGNSSSVKAWCITIVAAILVIVADKGNPKYVLIALIPTLLFFVLDAYYLALERGFRESYRVFVEKLHSGQLQASDLYEINPPGSLMEKFLLALSSFSIWLFYATLVVMVFVAMQLVIAT